MIETNTEVVEMDDIIFTEEDNTVIELESSENELIQKQESQEDKKAESKYDPNIYGNTASEQNQEELFRELIAQYQKRLYRFVIKYIDHPDDAADITQQAFVEAARTITSFRGDSKLSTWLFGIAMNMVRNYLSRAPHRIYKFETDESLIGLPALSLDPSDTLIQKEMLALTEKIFSDLPCEMSEVLSLVAVDEISYQDAAELLDIPLGTVRSRVSRARAVMREHFMQAGVMLHF